MTEKKTPAQIKEEIDLLQYMIRDGVRVDDGRRSSNNGITWCICPVHGGGNERTGSLAVYDDQHWFCYGGCQTGGDLFSYVQWRNGTTEFKEVLEIVTGEVVKKAFTPPVLIPKKERKVYVPSIGEVQRLQEGFGLVEQYVQQRSIPKSLSEIRMLGGRRIQKRFTDTTGQTFPISYNQVSIPYLFDGVPYSINFRRDDLSCLSWVALLSKRYGMDFMEYARLDYAEKKGLSLAEVSDKDALDYVFGPRFYKPTGTRGSAYGVNWFVRREAEKLVYNKLPYAIITEGEFDELSGSALHFPVLANKVGKRGISPNVNLPSLLRGVTQIYVATDNDESGEDYAYGTYKALGSNSSRVRFFKFPKAHGDMNKMLQNGLLAEFLTGSPMYFEPLDYSI